MAQGVTFDIACQTTIILASNRILIYSVHILGSNEIPIYTAHILGSNEIPIYTAHILSSKEHQVLLFYRVLMHYKCFSTVALHLDADHTYLGKSDYSNFSDVVYAYRLLLHAMICLFLKCR
jgi:hypothetical protein